MMINLASSITTIEELLNENSEASLTYAALECRLAIERICYERLRLAHDYISHDDLKKWQPSEIVKTLIQEVDSKAASTFTLSISKESRPTGSSEPTLEEYQAMDFVPLGTQVGFNPRKLSKLWNGLARLALHIGVPECKDDRIARYGSKEKIQAKVFEALNEIKRINEGTLSSSGVGEEVSFVCKCGSKNRRRLGLLVNDQIISCINPQCDESYNYVQSDMSFGRRVFEINCSNCGGQQILPKKPAENLHTSKHIHYKCEGCGEKVVIVWRLMQTQISKPT